MHPETPHLSILLILGIGVFGGILGAWLFQRMRIPQVIGYIAIGLIIGESGLKIIDASILPSLRPFNYLALAFIGFLVGGELEQKIFKQYGRQFMGIMLGEGLGAFLLVGIGSGTLLYLLTGEWIPSLAGGLVFGAISSATDPASTIDVLWEYRSKGILTTGLISVVALDDALALTLYALGTSAASLLVSGSFDPMQLLHTLGLELLGSAVLGLLVGFMLSMLIRQSRSPERSLTMLVGSLFLVAGLCFSLGLDVILCAMAAGALLVNHSPTRSKTLLKTLREFANPIYVMFFVLVGAQLKLDAMPGWMWGLVLLYVLGRSVGKVLGTYFGGRLGGSPEVLQKYVGLGLFAQGGVAVGLSMMAGQHLSEVQVFGDLDLGAIVVSTVTATTLLVQLIGPPSVKYAITKTDEIGRNVTEEDIIGELSVGDMLNADIESLPETFLLHDVFARMASDEQMTYPVVDPEGICHGIISIESLKALFVEQEIWSWMIAEDVMIPVKDVLHPEMPLSDALLQMRNLGSEESVVRAEDGKVLGMFDVSHVRRNLAQRLLRRQGEA